MNIKSSLIISSIAVVLAGCQQAPRSGASASAVGSYTLVSVNGQNVPCTVQHGGRDVTVKSGQFVIGADQTCSSQTVFSLPGREDVTRNVRATMKQDGSNLTFKWKGAGATTGAINGQNFTMNNEGMIFAYRK